MKMTTTMIIEKAFLGATLVAALSLSAAAAKKPALSQHVTGNNEAVVLAPSGTPPALCKPCLMYGGDLNPNDPNAAGMSDEETLFVPGSSTYAAYIVPSGVTAKVTGILFNIQASTNFDPKTASYDIRTGISEGNGGTSLASGSGKITVQATGRNFLGLNEYTVLVGLTSSVSLAGGSEYWFNLTPECTNGGTDGSCYVGRLFLSNTTQDTNGVYAESQPVDSLYLDSSYFGYTWANWCDAALGFNANQCRSGSYGLVGTAKPVE